VQPGHPSYTGYGPAGSSPAPAGQFPVPELTPPPGQPPAQPPMENTSVQNPEAALAMMGLPTAPAAAGQAAQQPAGPYAVNDRSLQPYLDLLSQPRQAGPGQPMTAVPRFATGGPNAVVGEGLETATPQFDQPHRAELILEPVAPGEDTSGAMLFKVSWTEGPTAANLSPEAFMVPMPSHLEADARERFPKHMGVSGQMNGSQFQSEELSLDTVPAMATGGTMPPQPPDSLIWQGLGGTRPAMGNWNEYGRLNEAQVNRLDQELLYQGQLGGAQGYQQNLARSRPTELQLPTFY
jgi:hypothetical protein